MDLIRANNNNPQALIQLLTGPMTQLRDTFVGLPLPIVGGVVSGLPIVGGSGLAGLISGLLGGLTGGGGLNLGGATGGLGGLGLGGLTNIGGTFGPLSGILGAVSQLVSSLLNISGGKLFPSLQPKVPTEPELTYPPGLGVAGTTSSLGPILSGGANNVIPDLLATILGTVGGLLPVGAVTGVLPK